MLLDYIKCQTKIQCGYRTTYLKITGYLREKLNLQSKLRAFLKRGALFVGHHGWPAKKNLGFRWSKKAEITLETISFGQNISISIFRFSPFLLIQSYKFFKIYQRVDKEREKTLIQ